MRDPYDVLASPRRRAPARSRRPIGNSPRNFIPIRTRPTRRPRSASPRSTPPMRSSATTRRKANSTGRNRRRRQAARAWLRGLWRWTWRFYARPGWTRGSAFRVQRGRRGRARRFRSLRHLRRSFRRRRQTQPRRAAPGADVVATANVPLELAALGGSARVALPGGRMVDVKIPAGVDDGQQIWAARPGSPWAGGRRSRRRSGDRENPAASVFSRRRPRSAARSSGDALRGDAGGQGRSADPFRQGRADISPAFNGGRVLRLRGKGLPAGDGKPAGDLYVSLKLMAPEARTPTMRR